MVNSITSQRLIFFLFALSITSTASIVWAAKPDAIPRHTATVSGELQQWHEITLSFTGPQTDETATPNPFSDYRMDVTFLHRQSGTTLVIPGYFAADGDAGRTHASRGNVWRAHLSPPISGRWEYSVSFRQGPSVATADTHQAGSSADYFDGEAGAFVVEASDKHAPDFRAAERGLVKNRGGHYFTFASGKPWIVAGVNIPETLLGYVGFDNTPKAGHDFHTHAEDWNPGDPDWDSPDHDGPHDGRAIVGAANYIAETGGNSIYFMVMNVGGDGDATYPTIGPHDKTRYDISKLDQWALFLSHANRQGLYLHVILNETEEKNENYHDAGQLGPQRKLYYRMLAARFAHLPAMGWGIGEESDYGAERNLAFADHVRSVDAYGHPIGVECRGNKYHQQYDPLLGSASYDHTALQGGPTRKRMADVILKWRRLSAEAGVPWVIHYQEPQGIQNDKTDLEKGYNRGRRDMMWPALMSGGGGFEWYIQEDGGVTGKRDPVTRKFIGHRLDHAMNNFVDMELALQWSGHATTFFGQLPVQEMQADHALGRGPQDTTTYVFAQADHTYALYSDRCGHGLSLDLTAASGRFHVRWFNPREGGPLSSGTVTVVTAGTTVSLGTPPNTPHRDWAVLVRKTPF